MRGIAGGLLVKLIFKIIVGAGVILGVIFLLAYLYGFYNWLVFSYNFMTAVD